MMDWQRPIGLVAGAIAAAGLAGCASDRQAARQPIVSAAAAPVAMATPSSTTTPTSTTTASSTTAPAHGRLRTGPRPPRIIWDPVPFGRRRRAETVAYVRRHYGSFLRPTWRLVDPRVIVIHYTDASYPATYNTFTTDVPDSELHELPTTCSHYVIDTDGTVHQLVSIRTICRHTVGLNWTAIGIEHVGYSDGQVLGNRRQIGASLRLVRWLRCRLKISVANVIGHAESLSSRYHREDVPALRAQTHSDFSRADMDGYRARLRRLGCR